MHHMRSLNIFPFHSGGCDQPRILWVRPASTTKFGGFHRTLVSLKLFVLVEGLREQIESAPLKSKSGLVRVFFIKKI